MARHRFGGDTASWATNLGDMAMTPGGTPARVALFVPGAIVTFWNKPDGGSRHTELADLNGTPMDSVTADERGFWPEFDGPDGVWSMYADANGGDGPRYKVMANDVGEAADTAATLAKQAQSTADKALNQGGGGGVATVNDVAPDENGNVTLTAELLGALLAAAGNHVTLDRDDQFLLVDITDEDNETSPNRVEFRFQGNVTGYLNEYGELRVIAARKATTPVRIIGNAAGQVGDLLQVCDFTRTPRGGFTADGSVYGPNVGDGRMWVRARPPADPTRTDAWLDTSVVPPVWRTWDGTTWQTVAGGDGGGEEPPPDAAPAFIDAKAGFTTGGAVVVDKPEGADDGTLLALVVSNATVPPESVASGWSLLDSWEPGNSWAGIYTADGSVTSLSWSFAEGKSTAIVLAYERCRVRTYDLDTRASSSAVSLAPETPVPVAPATALRLWWQKSAIPAGIDLPDGVTERLVKLTEAAAAGSIAAADQEVTDTGSVPGASATWTDEDGGPVKAGQGGGATVVLVAD